MSLLFHKETINIIYKINDTEDSIIIPKEISKSSYMHMYNSMYTKSSGTITVEYIIPNIIRNKESYYSLKMKNNDNNNSYMAFKNIEDILIDKYNDDLNEIINIKDIDNLYPMNIIIKR